MLQNIQETRYFIYMNITKYNINQSIKDPHKATHTRAEEKPHPSATSGVANPASRSDTGLGGCKSQL